ncbi:hypothetical protein BANRA_04016 [Acinetobacter baumannii]|nr:hypothetical protein BANRA_04016 [Acinetobacter baumannii]
MMLSSPLMSTQDKQRLWVQLRAGLSGQALATAQTLGLNLSLAQLNQIQANPLNYLWSKTNDVDYAYLILLGRLANNDLGNAFANVQRVAQGTPESVQSISIEP